MCVCARARAHLNLHKYRYYYLEITSITEIAENGGEGYQHELEITAMLNSL